MILFKDIAEENPDFIDIFILEEKKLKPITLSLSKENKFLHYVDFRT